MQARAPLCAAVLVCGLALVPRAGLAADPAATAFDEGTRSFRQGQYAEAAEAYERAASLRAHPLPLVNAAEAWERAGHAVQAANACDRALALGVEGEMRPKIEARLRRILRQIGTLDISGPPRFGVRVDGADVLHAPARLRVSPGKHRLEVLDESTNDSVLREASVAAGEEAHVVLSESRIEIAVPVRDAMHAEASATPAPQRSEAARDAASSGPPLGTWIAFGIAGAAGIASGIFGGLTLGAKSDYDARPTSASADAFDRNRLITNIGLAVTGVAAITGVVLWIAKPARAPVQVGIGGSHLIVGGRF
jgi:hypothetical protein